MTGGCLATGCNTFPCVTCKLAAFHTHLTVRNVDTAGYCQYLGNGVLLLVRMELFFKRSGGDNVTGSYEFCANYLISFAKYFPF